MKQGIILLIITIMLITVCGCTQTSPTSPPQANLTTPAITTESQTVITTPTPQKTTVSDNTIRIKKLAFDPVTITVKVGSTVRWVNQDSVPHRILFEDGKDSNMLAASQSWSRKFDEAGTYNYACTIHPTMQGTVIVN